MTRPTKRTQVVYSTLPCRIGRYDWRVSVVVMKKRPSCLLQWRKHGHQEWSWEHQWKCSDKTDLPNEALGLLRHHEHELSLALAAASYHIQIPYRFTLQLEACIKRWRFLLNVEALDTRSALIQLVGELSHCGRPASDLRASQLALPF